MADDLATAERVFEMAGEPLTDPGRAAMADYLDGHRRGRLGSVRTSPEQFGLTEAGLRARFAPYVERFLAEPAGTLTTRTRSNNADTRQVGTT